MADDAFHANYRKQKAALAAAERTGDTKRIKTAATTGLRSFEAHGYPDDWERWNRAYRDAEAKERFGPSRWRTRPSHPKTRGERKGIEVRLTRRSGRRRYRGR